MRKEVAHQAGAWLINFNKYPILWALPALGVILPLFTILLSRFEKGMGLLVLITDDCLCDLDCWRNHVPVRYAIKHDAKCQSDHVGCDI